MCWHLLKLVNLQQKCLLIWHTLSKSRVSVSVWPVGVTTGSDVQISTKINMNVEIMLKFVEHCKHWQKCVLIWTHTHTLISTHTHINTHNTQRQFLAQGHTSTCTFQFSHDRHAWTCAYMPQVGGKSLCVYKHMCIPYYRAINVHKYSGVFTDGNAFSSEIIEDVKISTLHNDW